ncbi:MAG TPA: hypothetical protein VLI54_02720 [Bacillota bacterium]|nr:hypothetical protein [Bacillota bacterium]
MEPKQKRLLLITGGAVFGLFILIAFVSLLAGHSITVNVVAIPEDSSISLDGKTIKAGKVRMSRGEHTLTATRQFFDKATRKINTADIDTAQPLYILPIPKSPSAIDYLTKNPKVQQQRESAGGIISIQNQQIITKKYPIVGNLPYKTLDFRIDYSLDDEYNLSLTITTFPIAVQSEDAARYNADVSRYKQEALAYLQSQKVDTSKVSITYKTE